MIINFRNVDLGGNVITNPDASLVADETTAKTILESMFFNNITLTINVGLGFNPATGTAVTGSGLGGSNSNTEVELTYGTLRTALLNSGQPNFFTATNLPAGDNLPINVPPVGQMPLTISNFWVTSAQAKALGLPPSPNAGVDGSFGIGFGIVDGVDRTVPAGPDRVATILHEVGHVMGRLPDNRLRFVDGVEEYPEQDLFRFFSAGNRIIIPGGGGFFSIDGGATRLVNWSSRSATDFANPSNFTDFSPTRFLDPYNQTIVFRNTIGDRLTPLDIQLNDALGFSTVSPVMNPAPPAGTSGFMVL